VVTSPCMGLRTLTQATAAYSITCKEALQPLGSRDLSQIHIPQQVLLRDATPIFYVTSQWKAGPSHFFLKAARVTGTDLPVQLL
jgi:hypothetical protein